MARCEVVFSFRCGFPLWVLLCFLFQASTVGQQRKFNFEKKEHEPERLKAQEREIRKRWEKELSQVSGRQNERSVTQESATDSEFVTPRSKSRFVLFAISSAGLVWLLVTSRHRNVVRNGFAKGRCCYCEGPFEYPTTGVGETVECPHCSKPGPLLSPTRFSRLASLTWSPIYWISEAYAQRTSGTVKLSPFWPFTPLGQSVVIVICGFTFMRALGRMEAIDAFIRTAITAAALLFSRYITIVYWNNKKAKLDEASMTDAAKVTVLQYLIANPQKPRIAFWSLAGGMALASLVAGSTINRLNEYSGEAAKLHLLAGIHTQELLTNPVYALGLLFDSPSGADLLEPGFAAERAIGDWYTRIQHEKHSKWIAQLGTLVAFVLGGVFFCMEKRFHLQHTERDGRVQQHSST